MIAAGNIKTTRRKFIGMIMPANIPKAFMGINGLKALAKKPTDVVLEVTEVALKARLQV
jgi:hypothetical protein